MTSQISQIGDMTLVNMLSGAIVTATGASPPTFIPGMDWYDTGNSLLKQWQPGTNTWVSSPAPGTRYIALLTADPVANGVVNVSDTGFIECSTGGYARQPVTFSNATSSYPSSTSNTNVLTFTMTSTMLVSVGWAALMTVSSSAASPNTNGLMLASWVLAQAYLVDASQSIQVGIGQLVLQGN
jgi:hypothetical protein